MLIRKWLPQNDLLAHPNLKVFVTHGGLLSTQEALFHKVPLVGVPISNDQKPNMLRAEANGYAKMLDLQTMTKHELISAIQKALNNESIHNSIEKMHDLFTNHSFGGSPSINCKCLKLFYIKIDYSFMIYNYNKKKNTVQMVYQTFMHIFILLVDNEIVFLLYEQMFQTKEKENIKFEKLF